MTSVMSALYNWKKIQTTQQQLNDQIRDRGYGDSALAVRLANLLEQPSLTSVEAWVSLRSSLDALEESTAPDYYSNTGQVSGYFNDIHESLDALQMFLVEPDSVSEIF